MSWTLSEKLWSFGTQFPDKEIKHLKVTHVKNVTRQVQQLSLKQLNGTILLGLFEAQKSLFEVFEIS